MDREERDASEGGFETQNWIDPTNLSSEGSRTARVKESDSRGDAADTHARNGPQTGGAQADWS